MDKPRLICRWPIRTPSGAFAPEITLAGAPVDGDSADETRRVWFFAACALRSLQPEAVRGACELDAQLSLTTTPCHPSSVDRQAAEWLADRLTRAVEYGRVRFKNIVESVSVPLIEQPESPDDVASSELDFIEVVLVDGACHGIPNVRYQLTLPNGRVIHGYTDQLGQIWAPPTPRGQCQLVFSK
jgi:hypothetical protein